MKHLLKGFKKVSEDDKSTTFEHKNGHRIQIAHSGLDKNMRKNLKELHLADGGTVNNLHDDYSGNSQDVKRAVFQKGFSGTGQAGHDDTDAEYAQRRRDFGPSTPRLQLPAGMHYADGTANAGELNLNLSGNVPQIQAPQGMNTPMYQDPQMQKQAAYSDQFGFQPASEQQQQSQEPAPTNMQIAPAPQAQNIPVKGSIAPDGMESAIGQGERGIRNEAAAIGAQGKQEAEQAALHQNELSQIQDNYNQKSQAIDSERMAVYNDLKNGQIDPDHFVHSMSGFGQAMTAIGLMLGGYGAGINGGSNKAMDFLNSQIDRDINAQKANLGKKESLLSHLNEQFGNLKDATTMAKAIQMDMYSTKMQEIAAQSKSPIAAAEADKRISEWHLQHEPQMQELKMRQAILGGMQNGQVSPATAVPWMIPPAHQAKALEEIKDAEVANRGLQQVTDAMHAVQGLQGMDRLTSPIQSRSQINAINLKIDSATKELFGKLSDNELQMMEASHIGNLDSAKTAEVKLKNIQDMFQKHMSTPTLDAFGIKVPRMNTNVRRNPNAR